MKVQEVHKHKMEIVTSEIVPLFDGKIIQGKPNYSRLNKKDVFTFKACKCGFKQPIKVEREDI